MKDDQKPCVNYTPPCVQKTSLCHAEGYIQNNVNSNRFNLLSSKNTPTDLPDAFVLSVLEDHQGQSFDDLEGSSTEEFCKTNNRFSKEDMQLQPVQQINTMYVCSAEYHPRRPTLLVQLREGLLEALVDSGADLNLIQSQLVEKSDLESVDISLHLASAEQKMRPVGKTKINFKIKGVHFQATFYVVKSLRHPMILGMPFLRSQHATIDFSRGSVSLGIQQRLTAYWANMNPVPLIGVKLPELTTGTDSRIKNLIIEYSELFQTGLKQATTSTVKHRIILKTDSTVHKRAYPMSPLKMKLLNDQIDEMLRAGVIEPSTSPFSSPPVLVMRQGKKPRFCVDYRGLNELTIDESAGLPRIPDCLKGLSDAKVFTVLDLRAGYWQIPLAEQDKEKSAFTTPDGTSYQFTVMPFGLKNAPATFQRLMAGEVLVGLLHKCVYVYLDDIIVFSNTLEQHEVDLRIVFDRLLNHGLRISAEKCQIATHKLDYLGFEIDGDQVKPQNKHLKQVAVFDKPKNRKQLQSFLGTCGWLREHVPRYSEMTAALTELLKGPPGPLKWNADAEKAFCDIKLAVAESRPLHRPDFNATFILQTDASQEGMAAVLYQEPQKGQRRIISFASAKFKPSERKWHVNEQECLALVWAIQHYRAYLEDRPFLVRTDSTCLTWLQKFKDSRAKLTRWALLLQEFSFTLQHIKGKENQLPDLLSRLPDEADYTAQPDDERLVPPDVHDVENEKNPIDDDNEKYHYKVADFCLITLDELHDQVAKEQRKSQVIQDTKEAVLNLEGQSNLNNAQEKLLTEYVVNADLLWRRHPNGDRLVVPKNAIPMVLHRFHDPEDMAHPGTRETKRKLAKRFYWGCMDRDIYQYIRRCIPCSLVKGQQRQPAAPARPLVPQCPWEMVSCDTLGPFPNAASTRHRFVVVFECLFSKWVEAFPTSTVTADRVVNLMRNEIIARYGAPRIFVSDNGPCFASKKMHNLCEENGIEQRFSPIYHQQANPVERRVQELKKVLKILLLDRPASHWEKQLPLALQVLRTRENRATKETPSSIVLGYELPIPGEWKTAWTRYRTIQNSKNRRKKNRTIFSRQLKFQNQTYPNKDVAPKVTFTVGQKVNVRARAAGAFAPAWKGPGEVKRVVSDLAYEVEVDGHQALHHVDDIRPAAIGNEEPELPDDVDLNENDLSTDEEFNERDFRRTDSHDEMVEFGDEASSIQTEADVVPEPEADQNNQTENAPQSYEIDSGPKESCAHIGNVRVTSETSSYFEDELDSFELDALSLIHQIVLDRRNEQHVTDLYEELITQLIIRLDGVDASQLRDGQVRRKKIIAELDRAIRGRLEGAWIPPESATDTDIVEYQ